MPTLFIIFGIRFFFYSDDHDPVHVHISYGGKLAKIQVEPEIGLIYNHGISPQIIKKALKTVENYKEDIISEWHSYFDK